MEDFVFKSFNHFRLARQLSLHNQGTLIIFPFAQSLLLILVDFSTYVGLKLFPPFRVRLVFVRRTVELGRIYRFDEKGEGIL
jgi:hypothetical protein